MEKDILNQHKIIIELEGSKAELSDILKEILHKVECGTYYYESQLQYYLNEYMYHKHCIKKLEFIPDPNCKR